jgi:hypothetical protein
VRVGVFVLAIAVLLLAQTGIAHGQSPATTPRFLTPNETIAGITSLVVLVDFANTPAVRQGLDAAEIRARIEQRLHDAGLTTERSSLENHQPVLRITIGAFLAAPPDAGSSRSAFLIARARLEQPVTIRTDTVASAITWEDNIVSSGYADSYGATLNALVDREVSTFLDVYQTVTKETHSSEH